MLKPDVVPEEVGRQLSSRLFSKPGSSLVSRLTRWRCGPAFTWDLHQCPLRIEYSSSLLRRVRAAGAQTDACGLLFGVRRGHAISLVATRRRAGLEPMGSFISRASGGVVLADEDLRRFEKSPVMLVISGNSAGIFVRDAAGAFGTVGNYEDFSRRASTRADPPRPALTIKPRPRLAALGVGACLVLALALTPFIPFRLGKSQDPIALNVREDKGQLHISWSATRQRMLTILDRGERISLGIAPQQSSLTYARHSGDVTVGIGSAQVRFIGPAAPTSEMEQMRVGVGVLESKIACLRAVLASGQTKLAGLESHRVTQALIANPGH